MREKHFDFIRKDLKERGETPTSPVTFLGAVYMLKVKKEGEKRAKKVVYSAAENILNGYRAILYYRD
jgi:hypothetical protein